MYSSEMGLEMAEIWLSHVTGRDHPSSRRNFSPPAKIFSWNYNCQIRHIKLHYKQFFSTQTTTRNSKLAQINKKFPIQKRITTPKVKIKLQINLQNSQMLQINAKA